MTHRHGFPLLPDGEARKSHHSKFGFIEGPLSFDGLSINAKTPFDELRVSGKSPFKSNPQPLRLSLSKPRFGENRQFLRGEGWGEVNEPLPLLVRKPMRHIRFL
jgi:hypothetical protein